MLFTKQSHMTAFAVMGAILICFLTAPTMADSAAPPVLLVELSDTTVTAGADDAWVSIYLQNYQDTLAAFSIHIMADQPDIIEFQTNTSDPYGGVEIAGTAISGWQFVGAQSFSDNRTDIKVTALANTLGPPFNPGLPPQEEPVLLFRIRFHVAGTLPFASDSVVTLHITENLEHTGFSDPSGNLIGTMTNYNICDTTYWQCLEWSGDTCLAWAPSNPVNADSVRIDTFFTYWCCDEWVDDTCLDWIVCLPPGDSVEINSQIWTSLDTSVVFYTNGTVTVTGEESCCQFPGDVNDDAIVNIGDPVFLINYIFRGGFAPPCPQSADCNGDCEINVGDVMCMIRPIFQLWPFVPLECAPDTCLYGGY